MILTTEQKNTFLQIRKKYHANQKISSKELNQLISFLSTFQTVKEWQAFKAVMEDYHNYKEWLKITG